MLGLSKRGERKRAHTLSFFFFLFILILPISIAEETGGDYLSYLTTSRANSLYCKIIGGCNYTASITAPDFLLPNGSSCCGEGGGGIGSGGASPFTDVDNIFIYNDTGKITLNQSRMNITVPLIKVNNATHSDTTSVWASVSDFVKQWFYSNAGQLDFNESLLNSTIDARSSDLGTPTAYNGSQLTGTSGSTGRNLTSGNGIVSIDNSFLHPDYDYSYNTDHFSFLNPIWDEQLVTVWSNSMSFTNYNASSLSGSDGSTLRSLSETNVRQAVVDNALLHPNFDYTTNSTHITFQNEIWNTQVITIWK